MTTNEATGIIRCALESSRARLIRHGGTALDESWCIDKPLAALETLRSELDEAFRVRDLAREASNRDLEAKRAAEAEKDRQGLSYCALEAQYETACQIIREERPQAEQLRADLAEALTALQNIHKFPALPFPDPLAHSWRAFGESVHRAYCDMQRVAATVLAKHGEHL